MRAAVQAPLLIDVSRLLGRVGRGLLPTGIDRVAQAYLAHFGARAQAVVQWGPWRRMAPPRESQQLFELLVAPPPDVGQRLRLAIARACLPPWPAQEGANRFYLNVGHQGLESPGLAAWLRSTRQRPLFFTHDLIPISHPEYCRPGEKPRHVRRMRELLRAASGVVANSACTLEAVRSFARDSGLPMPPAVAAPLAPAPWPAPVDGPPPLGQPYFVMLGTIEPRKNHLLLLQVWRELAAQAGTAVPHLVVIGRRGWECEAAVDLLERCEPLRGCVHEIGDCDDATLARWLRHARALLFPSFAEGYGLPLVEALAAGTPVVASRLPVFEEVAGAVPDYLHPLDGPAWAQAVRDYAEAASPRRDAQLARLQGFVRPTWSEHFARVEALMEELA